MHQSYLTFSSDTELKDGSLQDARNLLSLALSGLAEAADGPPDGPDTSPAMALQTRQSVPRSAASAASPRAAERPMSMTCAPAARNCAAAASPMPDVPPDMRTV